jgi:hypothetical protein
MGDRVRRILYPLVLPFIVVAVWTYASMMKAHAGLDAMSQPPELVFESTDPVPFPPGNRFRQPRTPAGYGFRADADVFATVAEDEE